MQSNAWRCSNACIFYFLGMPEGNLAIAQAVIYFSVAPTSAASYKALGDVTKEVQAGRAEPVPMHLRNAPTRAMKAWGYGSGYQHAHQCSKTP
jgi:putative ATPase